MGIWEVWAHPSAEIPINEAPAWQRIEAASEVASCHNILTWGFGALHLLALSRAGTRRGLRAYVLAF